LCQPPVDPLKWPAASFPREFRAIYGFKPYIPTRLIDCRKV